MITAIIVSSLMFPLVVWMADSGGDEEYKSEFSMVLSSPLPHLVVFFITFVSVLPRAVWIVLEHVVLWPEFSNVKSS